MVELNAMEALPKSRLIYLCAAACLFSVTNSQAGSQCRASQFEAYLKASNTGAHDQFGAVAIDGNTLVIGAPQEDSSTQGINPSSDDSSEDTGAVYVFTKNDSGVWEQQAFIKASITENNLRFGTDVDIEDNTLVVGAPDEGDSGAAFIFIRDPITGAWSEQAHFKSMHTDDSDWFGGAVSVSGNSVIVGALWEDSSSTGVNSMPDELAADSGAAYVFTRNQHDEWVQEAYLKASNTGPGDLFGVDVAISGDTVIVGAVYEDSSGSGVISTPDDLAPQSGAAYVFNRNDSGEWSQQAFLKASNTGANDRFGMSVGISEHTTIVGAIWERSSTTGINSIPDDSQPYAGAAYVFVRDEVAGTWAQEAYLKASNTGRDSFGYVDISGNKAIVGAYLEDSSTTGIDSDPDDLAQQSGAAYVYVREAGKWSQQAYLKASNTGEFDIFGIHVAISADHVVVGAEREDSATSGVNNGSNELAENSGAAYLFHVTDVIYCDEFEQSL